MIGTMVNDTKETEILSIIKESERNADEIIEKAKKEKEKMLQEAARNSLNLLARKKEEIRKAQEKRVMDFVNKSESRRNEKLEEDLKIVKEIESRAGKNIGKAADFAMKKFEELI